ncbi:MAG TPA: FAD-dependent oxidoreductase [Methylomirabilota bacterium]|jgi:sarcosine oxidase subunit beta|nr:FAD-dependent oxidoreductase [Methylomirabilota bacterium]
MHQLFRTSRMWTARPLKERYDVVIVGGGVHGLAAAYYLGQRGVRDVAVLEKSYIGSGASGRNTAIIRSNYRTPEGVAFYDESVKLYEELSARLGYNVLFSQQGHLTLAHTDSAIVGLRVRAEVNQLCGVDSRLIWPDEIKRMVPALDCSDRPRYPVLAALYHAPGGIVRHDAVVWGYARGADRYGIHIHPFTEVTGIDVADGRVTGVRTTRGDVKTGRVLNATAGFCSTITRMVGLRLPITTHPLQAFVTEPLTPFLDKVIVSSNLHVYVSQTDRGECVIGSEIDPYTSYSHRSTLPFLEATAHHTLELFPCLKHVRVLRQWAGICDMTPDYSPIMGEVPSLQGFYLDVGWGTYGFKAGPVSGRRMAELIATGRTPDLLKPFSITRFADDELVGEKAAAAVSH